MTSPSQPFIPSSIYHSSLVIPPSHHHTKLLNLGTYSPLISKITGTACLLTFEMSSQPQRERIAKGPIRPPPRQVRQSSYTQPPASKEDMVMGTEKQKNSTGMSHRLTPAPPSARLSTNLSKSSSPHEQFHNLSSTLVFSKDAFKQNNNGNLSRRGRSNKMKRLHLPSLNDVTCGA